jgi:hypothetical protein
MPISSPGVQKLTEPQVRLHAVWLLLGHLAALAGCAGRPIDVTGDETYHGGYTLDACYMLVRDVRLSGGGLYIPYDWLSKPPPDAPPPRGKLVPAGSELCVTRFVFEDTQVMPTYRVYSLRVYARIVTGPLAGRVVRINGLSEPFNATLPDPLPGAGRREVDRRLLRPRREDLRLIGVPVDQ